MQEDAKRIARWLRMFLEPGQVTELRAIDVEERNWTKTLSGYFDFDHLDAMAEAAWDVSQRAVGTYFIPNPVNPDLLARCANRVKSARKDELVGDKWIVRRKWLLVDADPVRPDGISSTDAEKHAALEVIQQIKQHVKDLGFAESILADSGNGYHLMLRVDWPAEDGRPLAKALLTRLANQFDTDAVKIDRKVFNAARIVKLYGTLSRKGDDTEQRPHRTSKVIDHD